MDDKRMTIGVMFGGRSGEHAVSLLSARSVLSVLDPNRYHIIPIGVTQDGVWLTGDHVLESMSAGQTAGLTRVTLLPYPGDSTLYTIQYNQLTPLARLDVVFPVMHGTFGEDGTLQGLLELTDLAYVGAGVLGSSVGMDKSLFKDVMRTAGINVLDSLTVTRSQVEQDIQSVITAAEARLRYPLFVKPSNLGSSVGITKCRTRSDLYEGALEAARFDRRILIEQGLEKPREIEVSVLGNDNPQASIPGEIRPVADFYTYQAKYIDGDTALIIPADLKPEQISQIQHMAVTAFKATDCSGMARVDFLLSAEDEKIFLNEVNTIPGFTQISMYPKLWEASGLPYGQLVNRLVELALERKADRDHTERRYGGAK